MKKIISLLLVLAMALTLVACGGNAAPAATEAPKTDAAATQAPAASGDKVTVTMITCQYGKQTQQWWADFADKFNAEHENIEVGVDCVSWNDVYTVVNTRVANGEAPDLLNIDVFADYQADGLLLPAKDWVSEETYAKFYPSFLEQSVVDGTVWAVPDLASARALYFNKDILGNSSEIFGVSGEAYTWAQPIPPELVPEGLTIVAPFDEADPVASCRNADRPYGPDNYLVTVDGFIVSGNVTVVDAQVIDTAFRWSDHNPVYMDFVLN